MMQRSIQQLLDDLLHTQVDYKWLHIPPLYMQH